MVHVAIIGAGPVGIYLSSQLIKRGFSVTLIEAGDSIVATGCRDIHGNLISMSKDG